MLTPNRPRKRVPLRSQQEPRTLFTRPYQQQPCVGPRRLFTREPIRPVAVPSEAWRPGEVGALIEFILLFTETGQTWPLHKRTSFWNEAATFVQRRSRRLCLRTGKHMYYSASSHCRSTLEHFH